VARLVRCTWLLLTPALNKSGYWASYFFQKFYNTGKGVGLRPLACWDCGIESRRGHGCLSVVSVVCCQVEVFASCRSLVQRSSTGCVVSECDHESSIMRTTRPTGGLLSHEKIQKHFRFNFIAAPSLFHIVPATREAFIVLWGEHCVVPFASTLCLALLTIVSQLFLRHDCFCVCDQEFT